VKRISLALLGLLFVGAGAQAAGKTGFYIGGGFGWSTIETQETSDLLTAVDTCSTVDRGTGDEVQWQNAGGSETQYAIWNGADCYDGFQSGVPNLKKSVLGLNAFVGWEFIPNWSVELRGVYFGNAETADDVLYTDDEGKQLPAVGGNSGAFRTAPRYAPNEEITYAQEASMTGVDIAGRYHWMFSEKWGLSFMAGWAFLKSKYEQSAASIQANPETYSDVNNPGTPQPNLAYRPPAEAEVKKSDNGYVLGLGAVVNTSESTFLRMEYNYYGVDFDNRFKNPARLSIDFGYQF